MSAKLSPVASRKPTVAQEIKRDIRETKDMIVHEANNMVFAVDMREHLATERNVDLPLDHIELTRIFLNMRCLCHHLQDLLAADK